MFRLLTHLLLVATTIPTVALAHDTQSLDWVDLIPVKNRMTQKAAVAPIVDHDSKQAMTQTLDVELRQDLDGENIEISGFVVPLEGSENYVTEFLLVPYFGACLHVPPPPQNQIIHVTFEQGISVQKLWDVVTVEGELQTNSIKHELAQVGYQMTGIELEPYNEVAQPNG